MTTGEKTQNAKKKKRQPEIISYGTFVLLVRLHEQNIPPSIVRMDRYPDLTKFAFGDKW